MAQILIIGKLIFLLHLILHLRDQYLIKNMSGTLHSHNCDLDGSLTESSGNFIFQMASLNNKSGLGTGKMNNVFNAAANKGHEVGHFQPHSIVLTLTSFVYWKHLLKVWFGLANI